MPSFDDSIRQRMTVDLEDLWARARQSLDSGDLSNPTGWSYQVTPGFPQVWDRADGHLCYYAFGYGFSPRLMDAMSISSPWARVVVATATPEAALVEATEPPRVLGIQGSKPLSSGEQEIYAMADFVESRLSAIKPEDKAPGSATADADIVRSFYLLWLEHNAVVAAAIRPLHEDFCRWVEAPLARPA